MRRSVFVLGLVTAFVFAFGIAQSVQAANTNTINWLTARQFTLEKTADLPYNATPMSFGYDCTETTYHTGVLNNGPEATGCAYETHIGSMHNGYVINGEHGTLKLNYKNHAGIMAAAIPNSNQVVMQKSVHGIYTGEYLEVSTYDPSLFVYRSYFGYPRILTYEYVPASGYLLSSTSSAAIRFTHNSLTYSANGKWFAVIDTERGVWRFDTETWQGKLVGWLASPIVTNSQIGGTNLAVSDDGQYIAVNDKANPGDINLSGLKIYDTTSCENLSTYYEAANKSSAEQCEYNDIWNGIYSGVEYDGGIKVELASAEAPRNIRFDGDVIAFDTVYDRILASEFKTASYQVSLPQATTEEPHLGLLALGDSYISGEGAFQYKEGTDTSNNKCHNSLNAYPYLLGARLTNDGYNSVACSGAVTDDITNSDGSYYNQLSPQSRQSSFDSQIESILNSYTLGTINQLKFIGKYKPARILLSIGGNDVNFSDVITHCVMSVVTDSCFGSQSERKELLELTYSQHNKLVQTYREVKNADSGVQLYVVGYPQIAKVGGKCSANVHLDASEVEFGSLFISRLNATIRNAAESVGVRYVDVENALDGYRLCEDDQSAMNGLTMGGDSRGVIGNESYHPTAFGHILLANKISRATTDLTESMPAATGAGRLRFSGNDPFITGAKGAGGAVRRLSFEQIIADTEFLRGQIIPINYDARVNGITAGSSYSILFHSKEVQVANGIVSEDGLIQANIKVPSLELGGHSLHIYATSKAGELVDITQYVYILASATDYDGDGIENVTDSCVYIANTSIDTDGDGTDDACDPDTAVYIGPTTQTDDTTSNSLEPDKTTTEPKGSESDEESANDPVINTASGDASSAPKVLGAESSSAGDSRATLNEDSSVLTDRKGGSNWVTFVFIAVTGVLIMAVWRLLRRG